MAAYVDSSVLVSALFNEERSFEAKQHLRNSKELISSWLTFVEVRRRIALESKPTELTIIREYFDDQLTKILLSGVEESEWCLAAQIAESSKVKSLDAIHLAVASSLKINGLMFLTFDKRQANAARAMGFSVVGA